MTVTSPDSGSTVSDTIPVRASVSIIGSLTVAGVQFKRDGFNIGAEDTSSPYEVSWNTTTTSNGSHTLTAVARDILGVLWTSNPVTVTVSNDTTPPAPPSTPDLAAASDTGASSTDNVTSDTTPTFTGTAEAGSTVRIFSDGVQVGSGPATGGAYSITTSPLSGGPHSITATATDAAGNVSLPSGALSVTIDTTGPTVAVTEPAGGAPVSGPTPVSATASDTGGVAGVDFFVDTTTLIGTDTTAPYSVTWNTTTVADGSHPLTARARDTAGNTTTSAAITVTVANGTPPPTGDTTPPSVTINQAAGQPDPTTTSPINFTVVFSEPVGDFTSADVTISGTAGGTKTATVSGGPSTYTVAVSGMTTGGTVSATIAAGGASDAAGNGNTASTSTDNTVTFDTTAPAPTRFEETAATLVGAWSVTTTADSGVTLSGDRAVFAGAAGATATFAFTGTGVSWIGFPCEICGIARVSLDGTVVATVDTFAASRPAASGVMFTRSGLPAASHTLVVEVTGTQNPASGNPFIVVDAFDVTSDGGAPPPTGDTTPPSVTINQAATQADPTSTSPITFTAVFSEPVSGFTGSDVTISGTAGGTKTATVSGGPSTYTVAVSGMTTGGTVSATIAAGGASDATGNGNTASTSTDNTVTFSAPSPPPPAAVTRVEETDPALTYTAGWVQGDTTRAWSGGTAAVSTISGAQVTFPFTGPSVSWIGFRGPQTGIARVLVDDVFVSEVDTFSRTEEARVPVFTATGLADAPHTLTIEVTGRQNAGATAPIIVVDAFDVPAPTVTRVQDSDPALTYAGAWAQGDTSRAWSGGTVAYSAMAGEHVTVPFTGTAVTWLGFRGPNTGIARVSLDGVVVADVDTFSATETQGVQAAVFTATGLADAPHTLTIEVTGQKNAASTFPTIVVDAFDVTSAGTRVEETGPAVTYTAAGWIHGNRDKAYSGGTAAESITAGAQATVTFTGTAVRWLGFRGPQTGIARVSLDGGFVAEVDMYAPTEGVQATVFTLTGLADAPHTVTIEVTGRKNAASTNTWIVVDAFDVTP